jgi:hypothetical protein
METFIDFSVGPEEWVRQVAWWDRLGGQLVSFRVMDASADYLGIPRTRTYSVAEHISKLEAFMETVQ